MSQAVLNALRDCGNGGEIALFAYSICKDAHFVWLDVEDGDDENARSECKPLSQCGMVMQ